MNEYRNIRYNSSHPCKEIRELAADIDAMRAEGREIDSRIAILKEMRHRHSECEDAQ